MPIKSGTKRASRRLLADLPPHASSGITSMRSQRRRDMRFDFRVSRGTRRQFEIG